MKIILRKKAKKEELIEKIILPLVKSTNYLKIQNNKGVSFDELIDEAYNIKKNSYEELVSPKDVHLDTKKMWVKNNPVSLTDDSFRQLCTKLHIPYRYMLYCMAQNKDMLIPENINTFLSAGFGAKGNLMLRQMKDEKTEDYCRAVLTDKYVIYDSCDILSDIRPLVSDLTKDGFKLKQFSMDFSGFKIRLVSPEPIGTSEEGKDLYTCLNLGSSDIGKSRFEASLMVYKKVCTNGLMLPYNSFKDFGIHISKIHKGNYENFNQQISALVDNSGIFGDSVKELLDGVVGNKHYYSKLFEEPDVEKREENRKEFKTKKNIPLEVLGLMDTTMQAEKFIYTKDDWGIINFITDYAKNSPKDKREELESMAGELFMNVAQYA